MKTKSSEFLKLAAKKLKIQQVIEAAKKDTNNPYFKSKYADLAEVVDTIKSAMKESESLLLIEQYPSATYTDQNGRVEPLVNVETVITDVDSGEWESITMSAYPKEDTPQAIGSVITYLRRYSLMPVFGVVPEDDDGNNASGNGGHPPSRQTQGNGQRRPPASQTNRTPAQEAQAAQGPTEKSNPTAIGKDQLDKLGTAIKATNITKEQFLVWLNGAGGYNLKKASDMNAKQFVEVMTAISQHPEQIRDNVPF